MRGLEANLADVRTRKTACHIESNHDEKACNANHALLITDWDGLQRASTTSISRHGDREHASCEYGATVHRRMPRIQERLTVSKMCWWASMNKPVMIHAPASAIHQSS